MSKLITTLNSILSIPPPKKTLNFQLKNLLIREVSHHLAIHTIGT